MFNSYQPNLEDLQNYLKQENEKSNSHSEISWWSFPKGMSSIRILPPWDPTGRVALPVYMHPITFKIKSGYTKYNWTCVSRTFGKPCQICEGIKSIEESGVDTSEWGPNHRQFYLNAIVLHDPSPTNPITPGTHVLLRAPKTFYDWVIAQITNPMVGDITSLSNGIDILVTKEGDGLGTSYTMTLSPNGRTAVPQEYLDNISDLYNLDDIFSRGFDQEQVDELVDHLRRSSGSMITSVNNMSQQMAGYQQVPQMYQQPITTSNQPPLMNPSTTQVSMTPGVYPQGGLNYMNNASTVPPMMQQNIAPQVIQDTPSNANTASDLPKCFGNYDPGSVNCVVCPRELDCSKVKNR